MSLSKEVYQALEDIVGAENISDDPAILDSYAFQYSAEVSNTDQSKFMPRPEAVLLPGSTEEVQAIVRACNRYRIKFKAHSTGWLAIGAPLTEGVIQLDLRRMNRILEIDEKNMFAVVEPYAIAATIQAEAMKVGLNCNMIGAGASTSPLAQSCLGLPGHGPSSLYMGHASEVLLGMEWVMPNGDILRTGSLECGDSWFCGEGPGPSLRGIAKGRMGAVGMGVFTKCALKLSAWPGPAELPVEGMLPAYGSPLPDNFRAYTIAFPTWQAYADTCSKIFDAEIGYIAHRQFNLLGSDLAPAFWMLYNDPTKTLGDLGEMLKRPEIQKLTEEMRISFQFVLAGNSMRDIEYQEKALDEILAEVGGWRIAVMSEPNMERFTLLYLIRLPVKNINSAYGGTFITSFNQIGPPNFLTQYVPVGKEVLRKHQETGRTVKCGDDAFMGCISGMGGGTYCVLEQFCFFDPHDKETVKEGLAFLEDAHRAAVERGWPAGLEALTTAMTETKEERQAALAKSPNPLQFQWQREIKKILDPNSTGDSEKTYPTMD